MVSKEKLDELRRKLEEVNILGEELKEAGVTVVYEAGVTVVYEASCITKTVTFGIVPDHAISLNIRVVSATMNQEL